MENIALQMGMNMRAWQNPCNFAHQYSGLMNYQSSKATLGCRCNILKYTETPMINELPGIQIGN